MKRAWLKGLALSAFVFIIAPLPAHASPTGMDAEAMQMDETALRQEHENDVFPEPRELQSNVRFWLEIYTKYDENQAIIHDNVDLDLRYETINMDERWPNASRRYAARQVTIRKRQIAAALKKLGARDGLCESELECGIVKMFNYSTDGDKYYAAADQIRVQYGLSSRFRNGLAISGQYMDEMRKIFERYGVPLDLLALPHVESSFNVKAYSRVGAAGIWQFMRSTGRHFMKIDNAVDERRDPLLATEAAARFLKKNYDEIGSWPLVVTSYNHGKNGMLRAKGIYGDNIATIIRNYDGRSFGFASRNFYCEFLAARKIMRNPERYFGKVDFKSPLKFDVVRLDGRLRANKIGQHLDLERIAQLNPALHTNVIHGKSPIPKGYRLRLPEGTAETVQQAAFSAPEPEPDFEDTPAPPARRTPRKVVPAVPALPDAKGESGVHVVKSGESLYLIAQEHGITVAELKELNGLTRRGWIYPGQKLALPEKAAPPAPAQPAAPPKQEAAAPAHAPEPPPAPRGFFATIASALSSLVTWQNGVVRTPPPAPAPAQIAPPAAQLPSPAAEHFRFIKVAKGHGVLSVLPGETMDLYAEWAGIPAKRIYRLNRMRPGHTVRLWQTIRIPLENGGPQSFEQRRAAYHQTVYRDFFGSHSVKNVDSLTLKKGQTAAALYNGNNGAPLWLIAMYNEWKKLDTLRPGEVIQIPVVEKKES